MLKASKFLRNSCPKQNFCVNKAKISTVLYTWGNSKDGALGHEKFDDITQEPRRLVNSKKYSRLACGENFSLAVDHDGNLFGWGSGLSKNSTNTPLPIQTGKKIAKISAGSRHAAAIDVDGLTYTWGRENGGWFSGGGILGQGKTKDIDSPQIVPFFQTNDIKMKSVSCGIEHTIFLSTEGEVFCSGNGEYGRLGTGNSSYSNIPAFLLGFENINIVQVAAGLNHSLALTNEGIVYVWGRNDAGQLGFSDTYIDIFSMEEFPRALDKEAFGGEKVIQVDATSSRSAAVTESGQVYVWGRKQNHFPTKVDVPAEFIDGGYKVKKVSISRSSDDRYCGFLLTDGGKTARSEGKLWTYGDFRSHMLGVTAADSKINPIPWLVPNLKDKNVVDVVKGVGHMAAFVAQE